MPVLHHVTDHRRPCLWWILIRVDQFHGHYFTCKPAIAISTASLGIMTDKYMQILESKPVDY